MIVTFHRLEMKGDNLYPGDCEAGTTELPLLFFDKFRVVTVTLVGTKLPLDVYNKRI